MQGVRRLGTGAAMRQVPRSLLVYTGALGAGSIGTGLMRHAAPWIVFNLAHSPAAMGVLGFAQMAGVWFGSPVSVVTDRIDRKYGALVAIGGQAACAAGMALDAAGGHASVTVIVILALVAQLFSQLQMQCNNVIRVALTPPEARVGLNTWQMTVFNVSWLVSPGLAGLLIALRGPGLALWVAAASALVVIVPALGLPAVPPAPGTRRQHPVHDVREAYAYLRGDRELLWLAYFGLFWNSAWAGVSALTVYFYRANLHLGAGRVGLINLLAGVATTVVGMFTPTLERRVSAPAVLRAILVSSGLGMALLALSRAWEQATVGQAGMEGAVTPFDVLVLTTTQARVPTDKFARVIALRMLVAMGGMPVAALLAGVAARVFGVVPAILGVAAVTLAGTALIGLTPLRRLRWPTVDEVPDSGQGAPA